MHGWKHLTVIRIGLLYPSIHNSLIANKWIEVKLAQHMMCAMQLFNMLFQMVIYFGGSKEWYEKLTPCNRHLLMYLTQAFIMSTVCRRGYPIYPHNIIIRLCPIIHISSTCNKWIVILDGLYGQRWVQVTTTHNIIARYFLDTLKQCIVCVGANQVQ